MIMDPNYLFKQLAMFWFPYLLDTGLGWTAFFDKRILSVILTHSLPAFKWKLKPVGQTDKSIQSENEQCQNQYISWFLVNADMN
jgi:hypothetical protein